MKHLIIIGAGGMGRTIYCTAQGSLGYEYDFDIKGFIDDDTNALEGFSNYPPLLGTIKDYQPQPDDVFVCSMGNTKTKMKVCELLKSRGAEFYTLIHKTAIVHKNAIIGKGCIIAEYSCIGTDCVIGENSLVQLYGIVGHDCIIGNYVRIDTHATCVGGVIIKDAVTIHTSAVVSHKVTIGEGSTVAAMSFVIRKVKDNTTVYGNPAKTLK